MKLISDLENKTGWNSRVFQGEGNKDWYYLDFYRVRDYDHGIRIEGTKKDIQKLVDMLNIAIQENTLNPTISKPGTVLKVEAVPIPPKIQSKMAEVIRNSTKDI